MLNPPSNREPLLLGSDSEVLLDGKRGSEVVGACIPSPRRPRSAPYVLSSG